MSGSTAKAVRRDIRRTVGEEAVEGLTSATNAINHAIIPNLNAVNGRLHQLEQQADRAHVNYIRDVEQQRIYVDRNDRSLGARIAWFEDLTLWDRLVWLVRGRR